MDDDDLGFDQDQALGIAWPTRPPASPVEPAPATAGVPQPPQTDTAPQEGEEQNPYAQFRADPNEDGLGLQERWRLNQQESYYRGTLAGSSRLALMANLFRTPDAPGTGPEQKKINDELRNEYQGVVADLAAYDNLRPWGTTLEGVAAATGSLAGSLLSPESYVGAEAKGATWLLRTARAAMQQGAVQGAVDPLVQWLNNAGGVQQGYDPMRTARQAGMGAVIGGGLHAGGELVGALRVTKLQRDLAKEDDAFTSDLTRAFTAKEQPAAGPEQGPGTEGGEAAGAPTPGTGQAPAPEGAPEAKPPLATGLPHVDAILHDPDTAAAIAEPQVNRTQDVPYTAGPDNEGNGLNIDRHFPESFTVDGTTFDPAEPFAVHEFSERDAIKKLMAGGMDEGTAYRVAHWEVAEVAEGQWYKDRGIDQANAEAAYRPYIDQIEHEKLLKGDGDVPENLFKKPYPHDNVNMAAKESAPVEKPTADEIAKGREILAKTEVAAEAPAGQQYPPPKTGESFDDYLERVGITAEYSSHVGASEYSNAWNEAWGTWSTHQPEAPPRPRTEPTSAPGGEPEGGPIDVDKNWTKAGGQLGSNPGGLYEDETGSRWYVKTPKTEDHARNEMLANTLYQLVGAPVPDMELVKSGGAPAVASRMLDDSYVPLGKVTDTQKKAIAIGRARRDFAADAWLANHDAVGLNHDNMLVGILGDVERIDQGGALRYRAQGEPKTNFGPVAAEIDSMRNPNSAPQAASVFGGMTNNQLIASLDKVVNINKQAIRNAVELYGPHDAAARTKLADTLVARQNHLQDVQNALIKQSGAPAPEPPAPPPSSPTKNKGKVAHRVTAKLLQNLPPAQIEKAKKLGFDTTNIWYHGTSAKLDEFDVGKTQSEMAVFTSNNPATAQAFIKSHQYGHVIPLFSRAKDIEVVPGPQHYSHAKFSSIIDDAANSGKDGVHFQKVSDLGPTSDQLAIVKPNRLRSIWAEFDPEKKQSGKLAALEGEPDFEAAYRDMIKEAAEREPAGARDLLDAADVAEPAQGPEFLAAHAADAADDAATARASAKAEEIQAAIAKRQKGGVLPMEQARAAGGTTTPTATAPGASTPGTAVAKVPVAQLGPAKRNAIQSLQQQSMALAKAIGFPLRQGRIQAGKTALGQFATGTGAVRVREVPDFEVVAHEGGHAIEKKLGPDLTNLTDTFASELAPLVSDPAAYDPSQHVKEGFAEYIRRYIGSPAHAKAVAPGFSTAFGNFLDNRAPQIREALDEAAKAYQAYLRAPSVDVVGSVRRSLADNLQGWRKTLDGMRTDGFAPTIRGVMMRWHEAVFDRDSPLANGVREMGKMIRDETGALVNLKSVDNPDYLHRAAARSNQAAFADMKDGTYGYRSTVPQGPSLEQAVTKALGEPTAFGRWDEHEKALFDTYLIARRGEYLWRKHEAGLLPNAPAAFPKGDAVTTMAELEQAHGTFRAASDMVHAYSKQQLIKLRDAGILPPDLVDKLLQEEFYVPFMRDLSDKPLAGIAGIHGHGVMPQGPGATETVRHIRGSARDIFSPIESLMTQTFLNSRVIAHNDTILAFERFAKRTTGGGAFFERVPPHEAHKYTFDLGDALEKKLVAKGMDPDEAKLTVAGIADQAGEDPLMGSFFRMERTSPRGEPIVFYRDGGIIRAGRVMSAKEGYGIYETLTTAPKQVGDLLSGILGGTSALQRSGIVTNPIFAATNHIKDQFEAWLQIPGYVPFYHGIKGAWAEVTGGESAKLYAKMGGVSAGSFVAPLEDAVRAEVDSLAKNGYLVTRLGPTGHMLKEAVSPHLWEEFGKGTPGDFSKNVTEAFHQFLELSQVTEAGTRNGAFGVVYKQKIDQGLSSYEAAFEAAHQATDLMDFDRYGSKMLLARRFIPFLAAHLQSMDRDYRKAIQPVLRHFFGGPVFTDETGALKRAGPYALNRALWLALKFGPAAAAFGYAWGALNGNNDGYRNALPAVKATNVVVAFGGYYFLIPKPYEMSLGFSLGEAAYAAHAQSDPRSAEMMMQALQQALLPPYEIPFLKTMYELETNTNTFTNRPIVPDRLQKLPTQMQFTENTSALAKMLSNAVSPIADISPIKMDYAVGGLFGSWGRDIATLSKAVDPDAPAARWDEAVFLRRLLKDETRYSDVGKRFWDQIGQSNGAFVSASKGVAELLKQGPGHEAQAQDFLRSLPQSQRAYATLMNAQAEGNPDKPAFDADERRLHPLERGQTAARILINMKQDLQTNNLTLWESQAPLKLSPNVRRDLLDTMSELGQAEMRNALVIVKQPGYQNQRILDTGAMLDKVRAIAPSVADEIATRYATNKVYTTQAVAEAYPQLEKALLHDGSEADLRGMALDAKADGYEFGGDRVKRPPRRRIEVAPQAAP